MNNNMYPNKNGQQLPDYRTHPMYPPQQGGTIQPMPPQQGGAQRPGPQMYPLQQGGGQPTLSAQRPVPGGQDFNAMRAKLKQYSSQRPPEQARPPVQQRSPSSGSVLSRYREAMKGGGQYSTMPTKPPIGMGMQVTTQPPQQRPPVQQRQVNRGGGGTQPVINPQVRMR